MLSTWAPTVTRVLGDMSEPDSCKVGTESTWWAVWEGGGEGGFKLQVTFQLSLECGVLAFCSLCARQRGRFWGHSDENRQCRSSKELAGQCQAHGTRAGISGTAQSSQAMRHQTAGHTWGLLTVLHNQCLGCEERTGSGEGAELDRPAGSWWAICGPLESLFYAAGLHVPSVAGRGLTW